jgi:hypothetical protein
MKSLTKITIPELAYQCWVNHNVELQNKGSMEMSFLKKYWLGFYSEGSVSQGTVNRKSYMTLEEVHNERTNGQREKLFKIKN